MRKLYAVLAGVLFTLLATSSFARPVSPDVANFTFSVDHANKDVVLTNTSTIGSEPGARLAHWTFGDGSGVTTGALQGTQHHYTLPGTYTVCLKIFRFRPNHQDSILTAQICKTVVINVVCRADFERIPSSATNPLLVYFRALPWNNNNAKPIKICWTFGDGKDTCITYTNSYTGPYVVSHRYDHPGNYEVCVKITYYGGCEARKCKNIEVVNPDHCEADFERIPSNAASPLRAYFKALPQHNNNKKPARICWTFGDGTDTCINYPATYTGIYAVAHNYPHPDNYMVCVKITYYGGCEARKCKLIPIARPDTCGADFERIPISVNNPLEVGFKALPQHNNNRKPREICWRFGDGRDTCITYPESFTGNYTVVHRYNHPGVYNVCVIIRYYGGCDADKCKQITVPPDMNCSVRLFEITPSITSLVRGFVAIPRPPTAAAAGPILICWYFGDGDDTCITLDPAHPDPYYIIRHTYPAPGEYRACVKIRYANGCIAYECKQVVIRRASSICGGYMVDSLIAPRTYKFKGFSIHAQNDQVVSYHWTFGDGTTGAGQEISHTYPQGGDYNVCLLIRTRLGCETKICRTVRVPGNNTVQLHLSPNPVINILNVDFFSTHTEQVNIRILNNNGVVVRSFTRNVTVGPNNWTHDLSNLLPGLYSYIVQSPQQLASAIFIKQ